MGRRGQSGFSLAELLVSLTILLVCVSGLAGMMISNAKINKSERMTVAVQANARNTLALIIQRIRSAGWDPKNAGINAVTLDPDTSDPISEIEVFADLDEDGVTDGNDEQVLIRHVNRQVVWRRTNDTTDPFVVLANHISNDADGDGTIEPMFVPDSTTQPERLTVRITAESPVPDPLTGENIRYTVTSDVTLRSSLGGAT